MKKLKMLTALFFALVLVANAALPSFADDMTTGTFTYMPAFSGPTQETFFYSDAFFAESAKTYNGHLLVMSYDLAISTFEIRNATYVTKLFEDIGFSDVSVADMLEKPSRDTIGTAIAHKKIGDKNVIAVAIRGEKYDGEWASNFIVGKDGNAKGLNEASVKVIERIKAYIAEHSLTDNKLWITGYSRAGTIADLAGVYINNSAAEFGVTEDDLYVFAFEPPAASLDDTVFDNIYIFKNKNDLVPLVYPESWGFHTNGKVIETGVDHTVTTYTELLFSSVFGSADLSDLLSDSMEWFSGRLTRELYSEMLEGPLADLLAIYFGKSDEERAMILSFLTEDALGAITSDENVAALFGFIGSAMSHESDYLYRRIADVMTGILDSVRGTENAAALTDGEFETLKDSVYPLLRTLGPIVIDDMIYFEGIDYDEFYAAELPDLKASEREYGERNGAESGFYYGYRAGFDGEASDPESYRPGDNSPEYEEAFIEAYKTAYADGYALGVSHAADLAARGAYDGENEGAENGYSDGRKRAERAARNEYFWEDEWMTPEYIAAYNAAYEAAYNDAYDRGAAEPEPGDDPVVLDSYHVLSVIKNISEISKNHHPQTNLTLVKLAGHDYEITSSEPAGCETDGFVCYRCTTCGDELTIAIPAAHKLTRIEAADATRDADGNILHWKCGECGKCFADDKGEVELAPEKVILILGDVNGDGALNAKDVVDLMKHIVGYELDEFNYSLADFDDNYTLNSRDVIDIMKKIIG